MNTANINNRKMSITYRTNTEMYTRLKNPFINKMGQYGADIYDVDYDNKHIVLVATSHNRSTLKATTTVITSEQYIELCNLYDPFDPSIYHFAIMSMLGFE